MPSLRYESQVAAQANRRIIDQPTVTPDTAVGDALQGIGKATFEIATRIKQSQTDQEIVKAERVAKEKLDRLKFDIEQTPSDTPDEDLTALWSQQSDDIIKEASAGIGATKARELWSERAKGWQGEGDLWTRDLGRKRGVDRVRAVHVAGVWRDYARQTGAFHASRRARSFRSTAAR